MSGADARAQAIEQVVARLPGTPARAGRARIVAIDGRSGAGKSTFARALAVRLGAPVVELELVYPGWDGLEAGIDLLVDAILEPIAHGRPGSVPRWDYAADDWGEPSPLAPADVIVVEGVGAGARRAARYASFLVWLEHDEDGRRDRALARDREMYRPHWERWARQEETLLARERTWERADVVLSGRLTGRRHAAPARTRAIRRGRTGPGS